MTELVSEPDIDMPLDSAARAYRKALIGVLLTGASAGGARRLADIRDHGGLAMVQDPDQAEAAALPRAMPERAGANHCLPLARIAPLLNHPCLP